MRGPIQDEMDRRAKLADQDYGLWTGTSDEPEDDAALPIEEED